MRLAAIIIALTIFGGVGYLIYKNETKPTGERIKRKGCCQQYINYDLGIDRHYEGCDNLNHLAGGDN